MKKLFKIIGIILLLIVISCEEGDPLSFYGGSELLDMVESGWIDFRDGNYVNSLETFQQAKDLADVQIGSDTLLIHSTFGNIHTGIGWCNLRLLNAEVARNNFIISQEYELYSFGASVGLMAAHYELGNGIQLDQSQIDLAIEIGHWIFSSGMPQEFENDNTINADDVKLLLAKSYFAKGILSNGLGIDGTDAMYWILRLDPSYNYINIDEENSWNLSDNDGTQDFDTFDEIILMLISLLEADIFPA